MNSISTLRASLCALALCAHSFLISVVDTSTQGSVGTMSVCKNKLLLPRIISTNWPNAALSIALCPVAPFLVTSNNFSSTAETSISLFIYNQQTGAVKLKETFIYAPASEGAQPTNGITFSPDGRFILIRNARTIYEVAFDPQTGTFGAVTQFN